MEQCCHCPQRSHCRYKIRNDLLIFFEFETFTIFFRIFFLDAKLTAQDIKCLGISTQRATFINWRRSTGKPFHNFITWKDVRADDLVQSWNNGISMKGIRAGSKFLHMLTRQKRFIVGGILKLQNKMVNMRLLWTLQNVPELMAAVKAGKNDVMFGTIDTWLLYKLSGDRKLHFSNISNIAASGNFLASFL